MADELPQVSFTFGLQEEMPLDEDGYFASILSYPYGTLDKKLPALFDGVEYRSDTPPQDASNKNNLSFYLQPDWMGQPVDVVIAPAFKEWVGENNSGMIIADVTKTVDEGYPSNRYYIEPEVVVHHNNDSYTSYWIGFALHEETIKDHFIETTYTDAVCHPYNDTRQFEKQWVKIDKANYYTHHVWTIAPVACAESYGWRYNTNYERLTYDVLGVHAYGPSFLAGNSSLWGADWNPLDWCRVTDNDRQSFLFLHPEGWGYYNDETMGSDCQWERGPGYSYTDFDYWFDKSWIVDGNQFWYFGEPWVIRIRNGDASLDYTEMGGFTNLISVDYTDWYQYIEWKPEYQQLVGCPKDTTDLFQFCLGRGYGVVTDEFFGGDWNRHRMHTHYSTDNTVYTTTIQDLLSKDNTTDWNEFRPIEGPAGKIPIPNLNHKWKRNGAYALHSSMWKIGGYGLVDSGWIPDTTTPPYPLASIANWHVWYSTVPDHD